MLLFLGGLGEGLFARDEGDTITPATLATVAVVVATGVLSSEEEEKKEGLWTIVLAIHRVISAVFPMLLLLLA